MTELENSVREMRRQQEQLQVRLREETQRKEELEQQIIVDQRRIRDLQIRVKVPTCPLAFLDNYCKA